MAQPSFMDLFLPHQWKFLKGIEKIAQQIYEPCTEVYSATACQRPSLIMRQRLCSRPAYPYSRKYFTVHFSRRLF